MKERPILFSAPMIRALLAGRKTQTRRIINPQPTRSLPNTKPLEGGDDRWLIHHPLGWRWQKSKNYSVYVADAADSTFAENIAHLSPYGRPGDRLWVKETHAIVPDGSAVYRADMTASQLKEEAEARRLAPGIARTYCEQRWRPSIHTKRTHSRITLEVTSVRAERLQSITEEDAKAEGVSPFPKDPDGGDCWTNGKHATAFEYLWGEINGWVGAGSWLENPWVWVVGFRVLDQVEQRRTA